MRYDVCPQDALGGGNAHRHGHRRARRHLHRALEQHLVIHGHRQRDPLSLRPGVVHPDDGHGALRCPVCPHSGQTDVAVRLPDDGILHARHDRRAPVGKHHDPHTAATGTLRHRHRHRLLQPRGRIRGMKPQERGAGGSVVDESGDSVRLRSCVYDHDRAGAARDFRHRRRPGGLKSRWGDIGGLHARRCVHHQHGGQTTGRRQDHLRPGQCQHHHRRREQLQHEQQTAFQPADRQVNQKILAGTLPQQHGAHRHVVPPGPQHIQEHDHREHGEEPQRGRKPQRHRTRPPKRR